MQDKNFQACITLLLKSSMEGRPQHEKVLTVCQETPQYLLDHGFPEMPLMIKGSTIDKAHFDHGITKGTLERLHDIIYKPKALYKSATVQSAAVVVTFELKNGSPIIVPLHPNKPVGREHANLVASVYTKEATVEARWAAQGLLLWSKK